jgi:hypothetical protein
MLERFALEELADNAHRLTLGLHDFESAIVGDVVTQ